MNADWAIKSINEYFVWVLFISSILRRDHGKVLAMTLLYVKVCSDVNRAETVDAIAQIL